MHSLNKGEYSGNILNIIECEGIITSKTGYEQDYDKSYHYHTNPHLSFILHGAHTERKANSTTIQTTKDVLFYHSGELHQTIPLTPQTINLNLEIDSSFLTKYEISETQLHTAVQKNSGTPLLILKLNAELSLKDDLTPNALYTLLFNYLTETNVKDYKHIQWCITLKDILHDNWNVNHSLDALSRTLGVHPITISKHFPNYFGCTLSEYVRKIRIVRSLDLLKTTSLSLSEISHLCGFSDQSHFFRTFKHLTGFNPKTFRKL